MNNQLIIHISAELIIIGTVSYYFNKKVNALKSEVDDLKKKCSDYETKIEKISRNMDVLYNMVSELKRQQSYPQNAIPTSPQNMQELRQRRPSQRGVPQTAPQQVQQPKPQPKQPVKKPQDSVNEITKMFLGNGAESFLGISIDATKEHDVPEVEEVNESESEASDEEYDEKDLDEALKDELSEIHNSSKKSKK